MPTAAPVTRPEIERIFILINSNHEDSKKHLSQIYEQCQKTNGRVTALEKGQIEEAGIRAGRKSVFNAVIAVLAGGAALTAIIIAVN